MATEAEIAWAAGIFEGEGSICWTKKTAAKLQIEMCDLDVLEHFQELVGAGAICHKTHNHMKPHWRTRYHWQVYARDDVQRILTMFLPWLHSRRSEKAEATLERLRDNPGSNASKTHCAQGHEYTEDNIYRWSGRACKTCHTARARARYHRLKAVT